MTNPDETISLTAPASQQRDANRQNPFSLADLGGIELIPCVHGYDTPPH